MRREISRLSLVGVAATLTALVAVTTTTTGGQQTPTGANQATTVDLDDLEDSPEKFIGKTVTVEGEVDRVLGPHLFTIDERNWKDLEREMPVVVPEPFAVMVRTDAPVRVTGTVQKVPIAQIEREQGF